ncbi:hypothetical protein FTV88_1056 [Heliorestis convoluta]|uniref:Uncharacterized protein n=1 Tax=Heliorestis convoluta TaxID=356322 RepID=A0A5Q2MXA0_9FIRM|nr:hypothetical protein FTV88_1056 [Heliorestis convoluta]
MVAFISHLLVWYHIFLLKGMPVLKKFFLYSCAFLRLLWFFFHCSRIGVGWDSSNFVSFSNRF